MFVFADETGNTGKNLFDDAQPFFLTAALVTRTNFDVLCAGKIREIAQTVDVDTLHANELGFGRIEAIADPLLRVFKSKKAYFLFSRVEKRYLLATKVIDHIFDSGENPAVPWHVYNIRQLRVMLVFKVAALLDDELAKLFWDCLMERKETVCREYLVRFCNILLSRVPNLPDARSQKIMGDAIRWAIENPHALIIHTNTKHKLLGHMPNMVAFANLLEGIEFLSKKLGRPVRRITHDRQSQFGKTLEAWHELFSNASDEPIKLPGEVRILQKVPGSTFEIKADHDSACIQAIDVVLWLFLQFNRGQDIPPQCAKLLDHVMKKGWQNDFSFIGVEQVLSKKMEEVFQADLTSAQMAEVKVMLERAEASRQENMAAFEKDGLRPFER